MKTKELKIEVPEGYEIDKENSTFECIKFKKKSLTYEDIAKSLFDNKETYYINEYGDINCVELEDFSVIDYTSCTSEKQAEKLLAINQLMNVAKYLNGDWKPNWKDKEEHKWLFFWTDCDELLITSTNTVNKALLYFKTEKDAEEALNILGEETIKLVLSTDW